MLLVHVLIVTAALRIAALQNNARVKAGSIEVKPGRGAALSACIQEYADNLDRVRPGMGQDIRERPLAVDSPSRRKIIFDVGQGDTATSSYWKAFSDMGLSAVHSDLVSKPELLRNWCPVHLYFYQAYYGSSRDACARMLRHFNYSNLPAEIDAYLDTPWPTLFIDLFLAYPDAKFILSTRPGLEWAASRKNHSPSEELAPVMDNCHHRLIDFTVAETGRLYELANELVRCAVPAEKLFEHDLTTQGTDGLAHELGLFAGVSNPPSPSEPFPYVSNYNWTWHESQDHCFNLRDLLANSL